MAMPESPLDPPVADQAPTASDVTDYDREHFDTYLCPLDAAGAGVIGLGGLPTDPNHLFIRERQMSGR
jgi:hypothetical protein